MTQGRPYLLAAFIATVVTLAPINASFEWTMDRFGTRALGMGGAHTAFTQGTDTIFHNWSRPSTAAGQSVKVANGTAIEAPFYTVAIDRALDNPKLRLGALYLSESGIEEAALSGIGQPALTGETLSYQQWSLMAAYHLDTDIPIGILLSHSSQSFDGNSGQLTQLSVATSGEISMFDEDLAWGASIKNALSLGGVQWNTGHTDDVPMLFNIGIRHQTSDGALITALDLESEADRDIRYYAGAELWLYGGLSYNEGFAIRGGLRNGDLTMGLGFHLNQVMIDYVYVQAIEFDDTQVIDNEHRFSLTWRLGSYPEEPKEENRFSANTYPSVSFDDLLAAAPEPDVVPIKQSVALIADISMSPHPVSPHPLLTISTVDHAILKQFKLAGNPTQIERRIDYPAPMQLAFIHPENGQVFHVELSYSEEQDSLVLWSDLPKNVQLSLDGQILAPNQNDEVLIKINRSVIQNKGRVLLLLTF